MQVFAFSPPPDFGQDHLVQSREKTNCPNLPPTNNMFANYQSFYHLS